MKVLFLIPLLCAGCSVVKELHSGPYPYVVTHHARAVGIEASVPSQTGDSLLKFRLGFFSDTFSMIPTSTNKLEIPTLADTFKLGNDISLTPSTTITEDLNTGFDWENPPPARHPEVFAPAK
jgi:hypothetical protein